SEDRQPDTYRLLSQHSSLRLIRSTEDKSLPSISDVKKPIHNVKEHDQRSGSGLQSSDRPTPNLFQSMTIPSFSPQAPAAASATLAHATTRILAFRSGCRGGRSA